VSLQRFEKPEAWMWIGLRVEAWGVRWEAQGELLVAANHPKMLKVFFFHGSKVFPGWQFDDIYLIFFQVS
jgi:hypothetical protein